MYKKISVIAVGCMLYILSGCATMSGAVPSGDRMWEELNRPMGDTSLPAWLDSSAGNGMEYRRALFSDVDKVYVAFCGDEPLLTNEETGTSQFYYKWAWTSTSFKQSADNRGTDILTRMIREGLQPVSMKAYTDIGDDGKEKYMRGSFIIIVLDLWGSYISCYSSYKTDLNIIESVIVTDNPDLSPVDVLRESNAVPDCMEGFGEYRRNVSNPAWQKQKDLWDEYMAESKAAREERQREYRESLAESSSSSSRDEFDWAGLAMSLSQTVNDYYAGRNSSPSGGSAGLSGGARNSPSAASSGETESGGDRQTFTVTRHYTVYADNAGQKEGEARHRAEAGVTQGLFDEMLNRGLQIDGRQYGGYRSIYPEPEELKWDDYNAVYDTQLHAWVVDVTASWSGYVRPRKN